MSVLDKMSKEIEQEAKLPYEEKKKVSSAVIVYRDIDKKPYYEIKYKEINSCDYDIGYGSYDLSNVIKWLNECFEFCNESKTCTNDILKQILEEIENEAMTNKEIGRKQCEGMARAMNIVRSHMDDSSSDEKCPENNHAFVVKNMTAEQFKELTKNQNSFKKAMERFNRNKGCMVYEVDSNAMEDAKPVSREFLEECAEVARKYRKDTEDNKCSDCSRRKWYQIGYRDGENINTEKIKAINKEMEDYLFEKYCIEGFDEVLDGIFKKYLDLSKDSNGKTNENCMDDELKNKIKDIKEADGFVSISDLVDRFVDVDEYYHHEPWNLRQIIANIDILIPVKKEDLIGDNWIPVEERLPNQNGVYNVTRLIDDAFISNSAYFDGQDTWHNDNRVNHARPYLTDIVAWQSLPKQYKPKKQD